MKGEIPYVAEVPSSKELDPWEISGKLIGDVVGSNQLPDYSSNMAENASFSRSCSERIAEELASAKQATTVASSQVFPSDSHKNEETDDEQEMQLNVAELTEQGQRIVVAHGGEGGLGNVLNSKVPKKHNIEIQASDDDQSSSLSAGSSGSEAILVLELKSIADVGFVGLPNAGKSTLLGAISRAKPSVGHYAFTTLRPNLGNLNFDDLSITIADIPGLIRGAHENRGLGHAFLRHIERSKVLAYVVDLAAGLDGRKGIPPWEQLRDLVLELEHHQEGLSGRPCLIVANKIDEDGTDRVYEELKTRVEGVPIFPVCAVLEEGIQELKDGLKKLVDGEVSSGLKIDNIMV